MPTPIGMPLNTERALRARKLVFQAMSFLESLTDGWQAQSEYEQYGNTVLPIRNEELELTITIRDFDESVKLVEVRSDNEIDPVHSERRFVSFEDAGIFAVGLTHKYE